MPSPLTGAPSGRADAFDAAPALGVLAEDLQGAVASAARLRQRGLRPVIVQDRVPPDGPVDAVVVDLDLHHAGVDKAGHVAAWAAWLRDSGCSRLEVRLNAELNGAPQTLVAGLLAEQRPDPGAAGPFDVLLVIPAYPTSGRVCVDGALISLGSGVNLDVRERLGIPGARLVDLGSLTQGGNVTGQRMLDWIARGERTFVFDGTLESHLATAASAADMLHQHGHRVLTASTGGWLRHFPDLGRDGFVLIALPGDLPPDQAQLARVAETYGTRALVTSAAESMRWTPAQAREVMAHHRVIGLHDKNAGEQDRWGLAQGIAAAAQRLLQLSADGPNRCQGVVTSGGLTTTAVVRALGSDTLVPDVEIEPLCPRARIAAGPFAGLTLLSKQGGTGSPETLVMMCRQILGM
ncbi:four-carbon acid sugar kinase family protein [Microbacterium sp. ASV81]|uniref:Four-carbon acid sugar kinase family protein n=1 Tax=Microbacterium capsulatum TaxID=3041921 RepID=A0ABU0XBE4_9MICO|nr:four-carbon acid sugar kinase family protein [Microbacterium sp. ASV81]MDQ4212432.1 four-carbon acid sugar kinase family protein [Microbacterium sp. ASV81]